MQNAVIQADSQVIVISSLHMACASGRTFAIDLDWMPDAVNCLIDQNASHQPGAEHRC